MADNPTFFTKHLFKTGLTCSTKLYYKAQSYPENKQSIPFIRHAVFNKRLLKSLLRSAYPNGRYIKEASIEEASVSSSKQLSKENVVLFDAIFQHQKMMARLPVIEKEGDKLTVYHVQTKAFNSKRYSLLDNNDHIHNKWRVYLLDFAYQLFVLKQNQPQLEIKPLLVLPDKPGVAQTDNLPYILTQSRQNETTADLAQANQQLLAKIEVEEHISRIWNDPGFAQQFLPKDSFKESLRYLRQVFFKQKKIPPQIGLKCKNCEFRLEKDRARQGVKSGFSECWNPVTETGNATDNHIFDLIGPGTRKWILNGISDQRLIPDHEIHPLDSIKREDDHISQKMRQSLQISKAKGREVPGEIIRPALFKELQRWNYPLHFLDFEAGNYAIPIRSGRNPYHLLVFQYSCHTLFENGRWTHHQWISDIESGYSNYELVRQLKEIPHIDEGTIVQYSNFERNALKIIRRELFEEQDTVSDAEDLISWIEGVIQRRDSTEQHSAYMADLSRQVKHFYYNRKMGNSLSIKDVLHSVMKISSTLKQIYSKPYSSRNFDDIVWWQTDQQGTVQNPYQLLTEYDSDGVRRGTEAMVLYAKLISERLSTEERKAFRKSLFRYCELDTLAMLMIYQHWHQRA